MTSTTHRKFTARIRELTAGETALDYIRRGWPPVPVPHRTKFPVIDEWQNLRITEKEIPRYFNGKLQNIGVILGKPAGDLVDVDIDCPEALTLAKEFLPETDARFGRQSKRDSHRLFQTETDTEKFYDVPDRNKRRVMLVEIRSTGGQTVFPGSVHESGESIQWTARGEPAKIKPDLLRAAVAKLATAALLVRHWPDGARHEFVLALAGGFARTDWPVDEAVRFVKTVAMAAGDKEIEDRLRAVTDTFARAREGGNTTGWPTAAEIVGDDVVNKCRNWLGIMPDALPDAAPLTIAADFVASNYSEKGEPLLRHWRDDFFAADPVLSCYQKLEPEILRDKVYKYGDHLHVTRIRRNKPSIERLNPRRHTVNEIIDALRSVVQVYAQDMPAWIGESTGKSDPRHVVGFRNGLLDVDEFIGTGTPKLLPSSPDSFQPAYCLTILIRGRRVRTGWLFCNRRSTATGSASI
jgi:hypothetical protein